MGEALTFRNLSMINPGPLYFGRGGRKTFEVLKKYYQSCGFRYITCPSSHELSCACKKHDTFRQAAEGCG